MFIKKIKLILIVILLYQTPIYSKSTSLIKFNSKDISKYFSGIVAFENKENSIALDFFDSSKILLGKHDPYLKKYVSTLVLENKVSKAINIIQNNKDNENTNFFDAYLLLILDSLKKKDYKKADFFLNKANINILPDRFSKAVLETLKQYIYTFRENKILDDKKNLGKFSIISETFQRCYLQDENTDTYFSKLINDVEGDYTRYIYFYLSYLIDNDKLEEAEILSEDLDFINTTLLLSQGKSWIQNKNIEKFKKVFSCRNSNDIIGEFLFLISNLYSSQDDFEKSNFYLYLSNYFNPKFVFNLSLVVENQYLNQEYIKAKKTLKKFKKGDNFYYWYRVKKEALIIEKLRNKKESLNFLIAEFNKIAEPNDKILFDMANFYKSSKEYKKAIKYYSKIINKLDDLSEIKSDLLYRRGGSFERIGEHEKADKDLLYALRINPDDAYILNYLAYSWLERDYKINEAIKMLEKAYSYKKNDPYIIDSIGWAYYLVNDYSKAEEFLKRAVELMPNDPIVNDHYGDILWKLDRKIQARYFWRSVLDMKDAEADLIQNINIKIVEGLKNS